MNLSGQSVREAMQFYKLPPEKVLVIFDDINLEPGKLRIRRKGSDGGHNGMKNIIYLSGSDQLPPDRNSGVGKKAPSQLRPCGLGALPLTRRSGGPLHRPGQRRRRGGAHREGRHRPGHEPVQQLRRDAMKLIGNMLRRWPEYQTLAAAVKHGGPARGCGGALGHPQVLCAGRPLPGDREKGAGAGRRRGRGPALFRGLFAWDAPRPLPHPGFQLPGHSRRLPRIRAPAAGGFVPAAERQLQRGHRLYGRGAAVHPQPPGALRPDVPGGGGPGAED